MLQKLFGLSLVVLGFPSVVAAQSIDLQALKEVKEFAIEFCEDVDYSKGSSSEIMLSGEAEARVTGLLKKLTDIGVAGTASFNSKNYVGVLQEELGTELKSVRECRMAIWNDMKSSVITKEAPVEVTNSQDNRFSFVQSEWASANDLSQYSKAELRLMRNALYAKYGYQFKSADLQAFFGAQSWYAPNTPDASVAYQRMSPQERANVSLIKEEEARR